MNKEVYIIGAGGHTRSLIPILLNNKFNIKGIFDDSFVKDKSEIINGFQLIGKLNDVQKSMLLILSTGDVYQRQKLFNEYNVQILTENIIHKNAFFEDKVELGCSNQIHANVYLNSKIQICDNNIINSGAIIEHETIIGSHNHISVGSILCGRVKVEDICFIGAGSVVIDKISICSNVTIGANSVVINDITEPGIYVGNPAKRIK